MRATPRPGASPVPALRRRAGGVLLVLLTLQVTLQAGCATATRLHTRPEGATVYVDGELVGQTPVVYDNDPGLPRRYHVQVLAPGYEPLDFYLDAKLSWLWGYVGAVTLVPYLWAWSLGREYVFTLTPREGASPSRGAAQQPPFTVVPIGPDSLPAAPAALQAAPATTSPR